MAWARRLLRRLRGSVAETPSAPPLWADLSQFHALAAAATLRAGVPCVLRVPAHRGMIWLPGAGMVGPVASRRWSEAEIRVDHRGAVARGELAKVPLDRLLPASAPGWRPLQKIRGVLTTGDAKTGLGLWLDTVSPYRDFIRYPRSPGRLSDGRLQEWGARLAGAYALLDRESPADAAALRTLVQALLPGSVRGAEGGLVASASSEDAFGAVALSLPHDETQTAAVLVHETRHQQLNALHSLVPLVQDLSDRAEKQKERTLYYAPWRSDPRPVQGLLHGVFAFAGVGRFWQTHRSQVTGTEAQRADFEFALLRDQLREAVPPLLSAKDLTEAGRLFVAEIAGLIGTWQNDEVAAVSAALALHYCALRRALWRARHLQIPAPAADQCATAWASGAAAPTLPPSTLRPRPDLIRLDTFGPLARTRLSAPDAFASRRRLEGRNWEPRVRAGYAAVAGDAEEAALGYADWAVQDPQEPETWIGAVLALPRHARGAGAVLLLDRPEAVAGVRQAVASAEGHVPAAVVLAEWLAGGAASVRMRH
ncbi:aKG-HExxH-type peptide beta-hydroxylase [Streptomyces graminifolii]|uniref:aKG-HExxH-type peptide beta-hydroxylase n=1 Tax=Streptomyces graminifolii TaxID=1266771 RepID=UPI004059F8FD